MGSLPYRAFPDALNYVSAAPNSLSAARCAWLIPVARVIFMPALLSNRFHLLQLTCCNSSTALLGGVFMGWGSMTALGCTVDTLLSGISAFALSGWIFAAAIFRCLAWPRRFCTGRGK